MKKITLFLLAISLYSAGLAQAPRYDFGPITHKGLSLISPAVETVDSGISLDTYLRRRIQQDLQRYRMDQLRQHPSWELIQTLRPHYKRDITYVEIYHSPTHPDIVFLIAYLERPDKKQIQIEAVGLIAQGLIQFIKEVCPLEKPSFGLGSITSKPTQSGQIFNQVRSHLYRTMMHQYQIAEEDIVHQYINRPLKISL